MSLPPVRVWESGLYAEPDDVLITYLPPSLARAHPCKCGQQDVNTAWITDRGLPGRQIAHANWLVHAVWCGTCGHRVESYPVVWRKFTDHTGSSIKMVHFVWTLRNLQNLTAYISAYIYAP